MKALVVMKDNSHASKRIIPASRFTFSQMMADDNSNTLDNIIKSSEEKRQSGMNCFPKEVYNSLIAYTLNAGKLRDAMLLICMANWGMRYSDLVRVRFGNIFDSDGKFKKSFTLNNGEKKTKKQVVYYNNEATETIISLYLRQPENVHKSRVDYLFVSESPTNRPMMTLEESERKELYDGKIEAITKELAKIPNQENLLLEKYIEGKITDDNFNYMVEKLHKEKERLAVELNELNEMKYRFVSNTPKADSIWIQKPISHTAGENIVKDNLSEIGVQAKNRKDKSNKATTSDKYNTHSLRKTFAEWFIETGEEMNRSGELDFDSDTLDLLKEKFKHSSKSITNHYTDAQEKAFKKICEGMNIGLDVLLDHIYG